MTQGFAFHPHRLGREWTRALDCPQCVLLRHHRSVSPADSIAVDADLCELQAGRIEVSSTVGKGSIFRCFITARSVDAGPTEGAEKPVPVIEGITGPNAERGAAPKVFLSGGDDGTKAPLSGLKILCCEVLHFSLHMAL